MQASNDNPARWVYPVLLVAGLLIAVDQLTDWLLSIYPFEFGDSYWRFRSVGLVAQRISLLLVADALMVAGLLGARKMGLLRAWAKAHLVLALLGLVSVVFMVVDSLSLRDKIKDEALADFFGGVVRATVTLLLAVGYCLIAGLAGGRAGRRQSGVPVAVPPNLATDR